MKRFILASIALCNGDWVFVYDGDEELTQEAQDKLRGLLESQPPEVKTAIKYYLRVLMMLRS